MALLASSSPKATSSSESLYSASTFPDPFRAIFTFVSMPTQDVKKAVAARQIKTVFRHFEIIVPSLNASIKL